MRIAVKIAAYFILIGLLVWSVRNFVDAYRERSERFTKRFELAEEHGPEPAASQQQPFQNPTNQLQEVEETNQLGTLETTNAASAVEATNSFQHEPSTPKPSSSSSTSRGLGFYGFVAVLSTLGLAFLVARDVSNFIDERFRKFITDEDRIAKADETYEKAEEAWARGDYLQAIELLREYLKRYPKRIHAKFRIAEIYESDLNNPIAAALEYEEILQHRFDPERWAWAAIHLCNLYNRIGRTHQAVELLRRIATEFGHTAAAEKARQRLAMLGETIETPAVEDHTPKEKPAAGTQEQASTQHQGLWLPRGFRPKK